MGRSRKRRIERGPSLADLTPVQAEVLRELLGDPRLRLGAAFSRWKLFAASEAKRAAVRELADQRLLSMSEYGGHRVKRETLQMAIAEGWITTGSDEAGAA